MSRCFPSATLDQTSYQASLYERVVIALISNTGHVRIERHVYWLARTKAAILDLDGVFGGAAINCTRGKVDFGKVSSALALTSAGRVEKLVLLPSLLARRCQDALFQKTSAIAGWPLASLRIWCPIAPLLRLLDSLTPHHYPLRRWDRPNVQLLVLARSNRSPAWSRSHAR